MLLFYGAQALTKAERGWLSIVADCLAAEPIHGCRSARERGFGTTLLCDVCQWIRSCVDEWMVRMVW